MHQTTEPQKAVNRPEKKFGPYPGGISVAVWLNTIKTDNGPRRVRSITVSPRRYFDANGGQWRDAGSYRTGDLPALIFGLTQAQAYCLSEPIPGEDEGGDGQPGGGDPENIPF